MLTTAGTSWLPHPNKRPHPNSTVVLRAICETRRVPRMSPQTFEEWVPLERPQFIAALDRTVEELTAAYGWVWEETDEDGLGPVSYMPLAWDGKSRFLLHALGLAPQEGVSVEVAGVDDPAAARADLLHGLGLRPDAFSAICDDDVWFVRRNWMPSAPGATL